MSVSIDLQNGLDVGRLLDADASTFREAFNRVSFSFAHQMSTHPLFDLSRLAETAERILAGPNPGKFILFDAKTASAETKFTAMRLMDRLSDTLRTIDQAGTWLKLSSLDEVDPQYQRLMRQILLEIECLSGLPLQREINWACLTVFIASPGIVTPYHIDHESNFLFQIQGEKDICLFNQEDRDVLTEEEIERFYAANPDAANYRDECQQKGRVYRLTPGVAVHHPPLAPHWVKNDNNVSVSVSIGFSLRSLEYRARVYQANYCLRRLGLRPRAPGKSRLADSLKSAALRALSRPRPRNRRELLFSGIDRITSCYNFARRLGRKLDR
jgi:hypothetical protein